MGTDFFADERRLKNKKLKTKNKRHILKTKILNIFKFLVCVFYILFFIFDFIFSNISAYLCPPCQ